jgi:hypothetical protein
MSILSKYAYNTHITCYFSIKKIKKLKKKLKNHFFFFTFFLKKKEKEKEKKKISVWRVAHGHPGPRELNPLQLRGAN